MKCNKCKTEILKNNDQYICEKCNTPYSNISNKSERQLRILQDKLFLEKDECIQKSIISEMFVIMLKYSRGIYLKNYLNYSHDDSVIRIICSDAVNELMMMYLNEGKEYSVSKSFGGAIKQKIYQIIYHPKYNIGLIKQELQFEEFNSDKSDFSNYIYKTMNMKLSNKDWSKFKTEILDLLEDKRLSTNENFLYISMLKLIVSGKEIDPMEYINTFKIGSILNWNKYYDKIVSKVKEAII